MLPLIASILNVVAPPVLRLNVWTILMACESYFAQVQAHAPLLITPLIVKLQNVVHDNQTMQKKGYALARAQAT